MNSCVSHGITSRMHPAAALQPVALGSASHGFKGEFGAVNCVRSFEKPWVRVPSYSFGELNMNDSCDPELRAPSHWKLQEDIYIFIYPSIYLI